MAKMGYPLQIFYCSDPFNSSYPFNEAVEGITQQKVSWYGQVLVMEFNSKKMKKYRNLTGFSESKYTTISNFFLNFRSPML